MGRLVMTSTMVALVGVLVMGAADQRTGTLVLSIPGRASATPFIAADGRFVVVAWSASGPTGGTDIYTVSSRDEGQTFSAPVRVNDTPGSASVSGEQPPRIALISRESRSRESGIPTPESRQYPSVVIVWTAKSPAGTRIVTARSEDGARTFGRSSVVAGSEAAGNRGWESIVAAPNGHVDAIWLDHRELAGAAAMPMHHDMPMPASDADGAEKAQLSKLYLGDLEGGNAQAITAGVCYCCKTGIVASADGSLFAVWRHVYPGNIRDIAFTASRDGGKSWAAPVRVSEDRWALNGCPENGPALAAAGKTVHVIWPTLISGTTNGEPSLALFYASTADGRTFTPRVRVATNGVPRHPQLVAAPDGSLVAAWDEAVAGTRQVVVARADADPRSRISDPRSAPPAPRFARSVVADADSAQYPALAWTPHGAVVAWVSGPAEHSVIRVQPPARSQPSTK